MTPETATWEPEIIAFCCNYCAYAAADLAGSRRMQYPTNVRIIHAPCTGKIEMEHILEAFIKGVDGILVAGCLEGGCHFIEGNLRARKRTDHIREMLAEIGVGQERLRMVNLSAAMAPTFVESVQSMMDTVKELGPSPLRGSASPSGLDWRAEGQDAGNARSGATGATEDEAPGSQTRRSRPSRTPEKGPSPLRKSAESEGKS
jgi:F420-non-reducing hydrogenase iron-sulfur subunit